jgi:hypothetical protein
MSERPSVRTTYLSTMSIKSALLKSPRALHPFGVISPANPKSRMVHTSPPVMGQVGEHQAGPSRIPIIRTLKEMRTWRRSARDRNLEVGIVPTVSHLTADSTCFELMR